jgi:hypothetical protein
MKRLIAAVSFAVLAVPALAAESGAPFEQTQLDRALPQIDVPVVAARENVRFAAATGATVSDASIATQTATQSTESPWANDFNFIAPAQ